jgi:hypothetical protein
MPAAAGPEVNHPRPSFRALNPGAGCGFCSLDHPTHTLAIAKVASHLAVGGTVTFRAVADGSSPGSRRPNLSTETDPLLGVGANPTAVLIQRKRVQVAHAAEPEWFRISRVGIRDAVIATADAGLVIFLDSVAKAATGWPQAEAARPPLVARTSAAHFIQADVSDPDAPQGERVANRQCRDFS